jgi:hypothetical protein
VPWSDVNKDAVADEPVIESTLANEGATAASASADTMDYFKKLADS